MAHAQQQEFFKKVKTILPQFFFDVTVLDIGSLDINGNMKYFFDPPFYYIGLDLSEGKNVDVVCPAHLYKSGFQFDVVMSSECLEHDMYYVRTLQNMLSLVRPGGLMMFTCASTGRNEHGTLKCQPDTAPFLSKMNDKWANYYKNLTEDDIRNSININLEFSKFYFEYEPNSCDLYFYGIKK